MNGLMKKIGFLFALVTVLFASGCGAPVYQSTAMVQVTPTGESVDSSFHTDQLGVIEGLIKSKSLPQSVSVSASPIKLSYLINITASGPDPEKAAAAANDVAKAYISQRNNKANIVMVDE